MVEARIMAELCNNSLKEQMADQVVINMSSSWINASDVNHVPEMTAPSIPLYLYIIVSVVNLIIFVVGVTGNFLVVFAVIRVKEMRTPTNMFLLNLSMADILVLMVCQPAALVEFFGKERWFLGQIMCKMMPLMENGVLHVSILTMLAVTAERYNAICHPFKTPFACSVSTSIKAVAGIWLLAGSLSFPFLLMTHWEDAFFYDGSPIKVCRTKINDTWKYCYTVLIFVVFFVLPFFVLLFMYTRITRRLLSDSLRKFTRDDPSTMSTLRSRKQVVRMLIFIVILFFVSLFPIRVVTLWLIFTPVREVSKLGLEAYLNLVSWARILMYVNSAGNPIIYSLTSTKFKMAFSHMLARSKPCAKKSLSNNSTTRYSFTRRRNDTSRQSNRHRLDVIEEGAENGSQKTQPCLLIRLLFYTESRSRGNSACERNEVIPLKIVCTKLDDDKNSLPSCSV